MCIDHFLPLCLAYYSLPPYACICFFNDTATTEIYTLSLHDALPISRARQTRVRRLEEHVAVGAGHLDVAAVQVVVEVDVLDRKSTRLNSSHANISYAVFCLKKKK